MSCLYLPLKCIGIVRVNFDNERLSMVGTNACIFIIFYFKKSFTAISKQKFHKTFT